MSILNRIAFYQDRRDEAPNQELARTLVETNDRRGVQEIADNLWNQNPQIQSDCIKVLYEVGYLDPGMIGGYFDEFLKLLNSRDNRLVWGGMLALSTIAPIKANELFPHRAEIEQATETGSVITRDNGVKVLAAIANQNEAYREAIFPYLLQHLATCRSKDVPQHAESILMAVNADNKEAFIRTLEERLPELTEAQASRLNKVMRLAKER